jgi:hypothetical protein
MLAGHGDCANSERRRRRRIRAWNRRTMQPLRACAPGCRKQNGARIFFMWLLLVISSALGTVDRYPAPNEPACMRLLERFNAAVPEAGAQGFQAVCVEAAKSERWLKRHFHYAPRRTGQTGTGAGRKTIPLDAG